MLHEKADGIATPATAKAFINFFRRRNRKRGRLFIVKGAESEIIGSAFFQFHKPADDLGDVDAAEYLLYRLLRNQVVD
jgi:hypothetical protein